jgi:hypothetical protein
VYHTRPILVKTVFTSYSFSWLYSRTHGFDTAHTVPPTHLQGPPAKVIPPARTVAQPKPLHDGHFGSAVRLGLSLSPQSRFTTRPRIRRGRRARRRRSGASDVDVQARRGRHRARPSMWARAGRSSSASTSRTGPHHRKRPSIPAHRWASRNRQDARARFCRGASRRRSLSARVLPTTLAADSIGL